MPGAMEINLTLGQRWRKAEEERKNQAAEIARLRAALSKLESSLAGERAAVRDAEARLTKARQEAQKHQQHLVSVREELSQERQGRQQVEASLDESHRSMQDDLVTMRRLKSSNNAQSAENNRLKSLVESLQEEVVRLSTELKQAYKGWSTETNNCVALANTVKDKEEANDILTGALKSKEFQCVSLIKEKQRMARNLADARIKVKQAAKNTPPPAATRKKPRVSESAQFQTPSKSVPPKASQHRATTPVSAWATPRSSPLSSPTPRSASPLQRKLDLSQECVLELSSELKKTKEENKRLTTRFRNASTSSKKDKATIAQLKQRVFHLLG